MTEKYLNPQLVSSVSLEERAVYLYHISIYAFPIPEPDLERLKLFLNQFVTSIADKFQIIPEYFVHTKHIKGEWSEVLTKNASYWELGTGLGLRPNRPLPRFPKPDEFDLESFLGRSSSSPIELELLYHIGRNKYFERFFPGLKWPSAIDVYLGCGGVIVFMVSDGKKFLEQVRQLYTGKLDSALQDFDFYLPLLDLGAFEKASRELLEVWSNLFDVCIMETESDPGILIASRHNLDGLLAGFQSILISENSA
jgi:hypothetical protein